MNENTTQFNQTSTNREGDLIAYDVPVIRKKWKNGKFDSQTTSMKDRIRSSKSIDEVNALLEKGINTYKGVSDKTTKQWKKAADIRICQLTVKKEEVKPKLKKSTRKPVKK